MKILVLGGTSFVGRHFVELALREGHEVTLFHRGKTGDDLFPEAEHVLGDRGSELDRLGDRTWDAVMDSCGYLPRDVRTSADFLREKVSRYVFISTISVYKDWATPAKDESGNLQFIDNEDSDELTNETYGPYKVKCEEAVRNAHESWTVIRPGLIFGPYDPTKRFPHWVERFATQEKVLVPDRLDQPTQQVDARDLAAFTLSCLTENINGIYNVCGPQSQMTLGDLFQVCQDLGKAEMVSANEAFLEENNVRLPLVMPADKSFDGHMQVDNTAAIEKGLTFRPWQVTARETWDWLKSAEGKAGELDKAKELEIIQKLH